MAKGSPGFPAARRILPKSQNPERALASEDAGGLDRPTFCGVAKFDSVAAPVSRREILPGEVWALTERNLSARMADSGSGTGRGQAAASARSPRDSLFSRLTGRTVGSSLADACLDGEALARRGDGEWHRVDGTGLWMACGIAFSFVSGLGWWLQNRCGSPRHCKAGGEGLSPSLPPAGHSFLFSVISNPCFCPSDAILIVCQAWPIARAGLGLILIRDIWSVLQTRYLTIEILIGIIQHRLSCFHWRYRISATIFLRTSGTCARTGGASGGAGSGKKAPRLALGVWIGMRQPSGLCVPCRL